MSRFDYNDVNPDMTHTPSKWDASARIFRLYTTVTVLDNIKDWNKSAILKSYDLENFVGVGFKNGNPQKYVSSSSTEDVSGENYIEWYITDSDLENHGLLFTYKGKQFWVETYDDGTPVIASFPIPSGGWKNNINFWDSDKHVVSRITFTSKINLYTNSGETRDPLESPFHVESGISNGTTCCFLCFNTTEWVNRVESDGPNTKRLNGANWDCKIFIADPDNSYFNLKPEIKTLELPSVYKPFYMRALAVVDNNKIDDVYKTRVVGNIYNGIGVMSGDDKYVIGTLSASVNETNITYQITGSTPTLLGDYTDCVHSFTSLSGDNTERFEGAVTDLTDIKLSLKLEEKVPEGNNTFLPNTLLYDNTVSFYSINFEPPSVFTETSGTTNTYWCSYVLTPDSFMGTSGNSVKYFFVSPHFWKKFIEYSDGTAEQISDTNTENTSTIPIYMTGYGYISNTSTASDTNTENTYTYTYKYKFNSNIKCNTKQEYEINPNISPSSGSTDVQVDFLSIYNTSYFSSWSDYIFKGGMTLNPDEISIAVRIDAEALINLNASENGRQVFVFRNFISHEEICDGCWMIIGITDPLVELINSGSFKKEKENGTVLPPHKDFISMMTVAVPTKITNVQPNVINT